MNGEGCDFSNHSPVFSARIEGANGRKISRCLMRRFRDLFHFRAAWIGDDAAIAQRSRSPFRTTLIPSENLSFGDDPSGTAHQFVVRQFGDGVTALRNCACLRWRFALPLACIPVPSKRAPLRRIAACRDV